MKLSKFGDKLSDESGIVNLMEDLGEALNLNPDILFLGGGNPAHIPAFETVVARELRRIADSDERIHKLIGVYQSPRGSESFIDCFVDYVNAELGWNIEPSQVALTNGSQSAFFILINLLAGTDTLECGKRIVFPMMPEYLGYADQPSEHNVFKSFLPRIEERSDGYFKYHVDFDAFKLTERDAAVCVSSPTNPTGNVLSSDELEMLSKLAKQQGVPLIIDCAYGGPFPGIVFGTRELPFFPDNIYVISCSKLGLPGARTGIVVGPERIIEKIVKVNTVMSLANGNFGPAIVESLMRSGELNTLCRKTLLPFYQSRRDFAVSCIHKYLSGVRYFMHVSEGAFFLWLWFPELPISSTMLYEKMKRKGVLIMDGSHFFFGLQEQWPHARQCIRLTFCQEENVIDKAIRILGDELKKLG